MRASVLSRFSGVWIGRPHGLQPSRLLCPWDSPGQNTGVGCHALLQGIFPTRGLNPRLLHLLQRQVRSLPLAPPGKHINRWTAFKEVCLAAAALWQRHRRSETEGAEEGGNLITHQPLVGKGAFIRCTRWDHVLYDKPLAFLREKTEETKQGNH